MYNLDFRFVVPALINLGLFLLQHQVKPWNPYQPNLNLNLKNCFFFILILCFLVTSVKLPLSVITESIRIRAGDFSFLLAISLLGSVFLPQTLFLFLYGIILCTSPCHNFLSKLLVGFSLWICDNIRVIPVLVISCIVQRHEQEKIETDHPQVVDMGGNPLLQQPDSVLVVESWSMIVQ